MHHNVKDVIEIFLKEYENDFACYTCGYVVEKKNKKSAYKDTKNTNFLNRLIYANPKNKKHLCRS